jgi:GTPase SAR1 family protein
MSYANLHPTVEDSLRRWLLNPTTAAFLLVGPPGVGKTTLAREILKQESYRIVELNASHTRSGQAFKKQIIPLLTQKSVLEAMSPTSNTNKLAVLLDEIDGLSLGEKGGLNELLDYMRSWKVGQTTHPLLLICNEIKGRAYQHIVRLSTYIPMEFPSQTVQSWLGQTIRPEVLATADLRVILRSIDGRDSVSISQLQESELEIPELTADTVADAEVEEPSTDILKFSHSCLYEFWDPLVIPEVENNLGNLSGLCVHENIHKRLEGVNNSFLHYKEFLELFDLSDKADYWAFFYQNWNLLRPSFQLKLKITNAFLSEYPAKDVPQVSSLQFTQVLTRQSSMYNTWKQMIQFSDEHACSIEEIPAALVAMLNSKQGKIPASQIKKIDSMSIPKQLCIYK